MLKSLFECNSLGKAAGGGGGVKEVCNTRIWSKQLFLFFLFFFKSCIHYWFQFGLRVRTVRRPMRMPEPRCPVSDCSCWARELTENQKGKHTKNKRLDSTAHPGPNRPRGEAGPKPSGTPPTRSCCCHLVLSVSCHPLPNGASGLG